MMTLLGAILTRLFGPLLLTVTLPALALAALTGWHQAIKIKATARCDARWEAQIADAARADAERALAAEKATSAANAAAAEEMRNARDTLQQDLEALRKDSSGDARCLSDRVLDALEKGRGPAGSKAGNRPGS